MALFPSWSLSFFAAWEAWSRGGGAPCFSPDLFPLYLFLCAKEMLAPATSKV